MRTKGENAIMDNTRSTMNKIYESSKLNSAYE